MKKASKIIILFVLVIALAVCIIIASRGGKEGTVHSIAGVVINEVMLKNTETCPDESGNYYDWIELYNAGTKPADISGCGLSDSITDTVSFVFPRGTVMEADSYLIIYCSGDSQLGNDHAPFKLSANDQAVFYDVGGNPIECIELHTTEEGKSLARVDTEKDVFKEMSPTPGYPNTDEGVTAYAQYMSGRTNSPDTHTDSDIIINEFMADNITTLRSSDGNYYDWIELFNRSDKAVNINGWYISDDTENVKKYSFPTDIEIPAGGYILIYCSGNNASPDNEIHVPFKLSAYEESVVLADANGRTLDKVTYQRQSADKSLARDDEGNFNICDKPTPGFPNTDAGYDEFTASVKAPLSALYISEMMGNNANTVISIDGKNTYPDYIELKNAGNEDIQLSGYGLTDNPSNPAKWLFPDIKIRAGGTLLLLATAATEENSKAGGYYQTSFSLSSDGETVYLFSPDGTFLDKLHADTFYADMSYGKSDNGDVLLYSRPTPGQKNASTGYTGLTSIPTFDIAPGVYDDDKIEVRINASAGENIYYTTDCSTPTNKSIKYTGEPIVIDTNTVIRAKTFKKGKYNNFSCVSGTYLLKKDDVNHTLPVMALVTDRDNLWDKDNGIYAYGRNANIDDDVWPYPNANFWKDIEVPAYFEVFDDESGKEVFGQNIGINIAGSFGQGREQKGFSVNARDEYGNNRMAYSFLPGREWTEYKSLCLRCGAQDQANGKIRDVLSAGLLRGSDVNFLWQEYKPYVLYLNGKYWGVYFMREKRNRFFVAQHEGLGLSNSENITLIKSETRSNYGSTEEWKALMNYVRTHDLTVDSNYKYLTDRMDIDSFTDYMICEIYVANSDYWNIQMYKTEDGKWKFIYYDFCWSWGSNVDHPTLAQRRKDTQPCSDLFNALLKRSDFREKFIRRFAEILDKVYDEERIMKLIDELYEQVQPEMKRERSLFNTADSPYFNYVDSMNYSNYETFEREIEKIRNFARGRRSSIIKQLRDAFGSTEKKILDEVFPNG